MFTKKDPPLSDRLIESETVNALRVLKAHTVNTEDYSKTLETIIKLRGLSKEEKSTGVSKDTLVLVGANLLGILMIIKHENVNVITSKALNMVMKPR